MPVPNYLADYADLYSEDPRAAARRWFAEARYGLFLHFGLYSLVGRHEWLQFREKIPVATYGAFQQFFTAHAFDAEAICQLAVDSGMRYINITTRHHDSFCLWDTAETSFNSVHAPCARDLVRELAEACDRHGLGLCLYYSHGRDWRHPHAPDNDRYGGNARPFYDPPEPLYATGAAHDLNLYLDFMNRQITELLSNYGPIASIWLDGVAVPRNGNTDAFRLQDLYDLIHRLQPQVLVAYKDGLTGTEDYLGPEENWDWQERPDGRHVEVCGCLNRGGWGYTPPVEPRTPAEVWELLGKTGRAGANLLLNVGPLPDGSIHPAEAEVLRTVGARLRQDGFPG